MVKTDWKTNRVLQNIILLRRSLIYQTKEFFQNSTLHGVRYIAESGRPLGEKFMWFCFTAVGAVTALIIIMSLWEKFQTNPTITGLDTDLQNLKVIFPTVVLCPSESFDPDKAYDLAYNVLTNQNETVADNLMTFLKLLSALSFKNILSVYSARESVPLDIINKSSLRHWIFQIQKNCEDVMFECKYRNEKIDCCESFDPVYTEHGFCYAFNSRFISNENSDEPATSAHDLYETDKKWALEMHPNYTVRVFIFSQNEYFGEDIKSQLEWETNQAADVRFTKRTTVTTSDARQLSIGQRKCIFSDEIELTYFKDEYTFTACLKECRLKKAIKFCKCNPPFYKPVTNVPICNINQLACLMKYARNITSIKDCLHCELGCTQTVYAIEKLTRANGEPEYATIVIEFLQWPIVFFKREVLFGWVDLLVSFGGIASLFLGFSLLSAVEVIYYFTMRACCMLYRNREELYKIEEEIREKPPPMINMKLKPTFQRSSRKSKDQINSDKLQNWISSQPKTQHRRMPNKFSGFAKPLYKTPKLPVYDNKSNYEGYLP